MMKKPISLLLAAAICITPAVARQLTPAQALDKANALNVQHKPGAPSGALAPVPVITGSVQGLNTYYVFNATDGNGYAVLAADDVAAPVLAWGEGSVDPTAMPEGMRFMLDHYSNQIAGAALEGAPAYMAPAKVPAAVAPFGKTKWDQEAPYNAKAPIINEERCPAGCAATTAAQCVKVFDYPERGAGVYDYEYQYHMTVYQNSFDFDAVTFDWADMLDSYAGEYTEQQLDAVATLMAACGAASTMSYLPNLSWCNLEDVGIGLIKWMRYDIGMQCLYRNYYTAEEWEQIIYDEVAAGRPVFYTGFSEYTGHAFMCDGYNNGAFHINWGWHGNCDGYYLLSVLDPNCPVSRSSFSLFDLDQAALVGIQPPVEGSVRRPVMYCSGNLSYALPSYKREEGVDALFEINHGFTASIIYSESLYPVEAQTGMKCVPEEGETFYLKSTSDPRTLTYGQGWQNLSIPTVDMPEGKYVMTPACLIDGEWVDVRSYAKDRSIVYANVTADYVYFDEYEYVGIADVAADTDTTVSYTTVSGVSVESPTAAGLYIRTSRHADGSVTTSKIIIR